MQATLQWAQAGSRFTAMFEALAIDVLKAVNVKRAAENLRLTWDEARGLMERIDYRGPSANWAAILDYIDVVHDKAFAMGHRYMTLMRDPKGDTVEYVGEERTKKRLAAYFAAFAPKQRATVKALACKCGRLTSTRGRFHGPRARSHSTAFTSRSTSCESRTTCAGARTRIWAPRATPARAQEVPLAALGGEPD